MSDFLLFTISLAVTVLGVSGGWAIGRRRGIASGVRVAAWSTVPMAAYLTGLTKFLSALVFSPTKWVGVALFVLGVVLYVISGVMLRRARGPRVVPESGRSAVTDISPAAMETPKRAVDPDLAEIDQILRKRGIS